MQLLPIFPNWKTRRSLCCIKSCNCRCDKAHSTSFSAGRNPLQCNLPGKCHHADDNRNRPGSTRSRHDRSHGNTQQSEDTILYSAGCGECHPVLRKWSGSVSNTQKHGENPTFLRHRRMGLLRKSNPPLYRTGADLLIGRTVLGNSPNTS